MLLRILLLLATIPLAAVANSGALIIVGLTGDESNEQLLLGLAEKTRGALIERGLPEANVNLLHGAKREAILGQINSAAQQYQENFWLVLLGHSGPGRDGTPSFQVTGPRLTAKDLVEALAKFKGSTYVMIGTGRSGEYLPLLKLPNCSVLSATSGGGEVSQPRFPEKWVQVLSESPAASFPEIAALAEALVEQEYQTLGLLRGEHPRLLDTSGEILEAPFGTNPAAIRPPIHPCTTPPHLAVSEIKIPRPKTGSDFELQPPTPETQALLTEAKSLANPEGHPALMMRQEIELTLNSDLSTSERRSLRVFLANEAAFDQWANFSFPQSPPLQITRLEGARIILPDGSSYTMNPSTSLTAESAESAPSNLFFPQATRGSIVEIAFQIDSRPELTLPAYYRELELQQRIPVLQTALTLRIPSKTLAKYRIRNHASASAELSETTHSQVMRWNLDRLPAFEPLPLDPPRREQFVSLEVSSFESWEQFSDWFQRLAAGAFEAGPEVKQKAAQIAAAYTSREERIKAAFEFVAALRYVAIEFGIHGFRPRTPEQVLHQRYGDCKDKANLLVALLREMEIEASFVLINRGSLTDPDFPGWQFNHAIALVPGEAGDLWLDSTEPNTRFGTISPGNLGRSALVFGKEGAKFKTVVSSNQSYISQTWEFAGDKTGVHHQKLEGLADYYARALLVDLSPKQRQSALARELTTMLPWAEFSKIENHDPKDLSKPMTLRAEFGPGASSNPSPNLDWFEAFAPALRDRPMVINDGQPLRYEQTVRWEGGRPAELPADFIRNSEGLKLSVQFKQEGKNFSRHAICEVTQPVISSEEYPRFRAALREWNLALAKSAPQ